MAELTRRDRMTAAGDLDAQAEHLDQVSTWLSLHDQDKAACLVECAARDLRATAWLVKPDDHSRPEGWLSSTNSHR